MSRPKKRLYRPDGRQAPLSDLYATLPQQLEADAVPDCRLAEASVETNPVAMMSRNRETQGITHA